MVQNTEQNDLRNKGFNVNLIRDKAITPELRKKITNYIQAGCLAGGMLLLILIIRYVNISIMISKSNKQKVTISEAISGMIKNYSIDQWSGEWQGLHSSLGMINSVYNDRMTLVIRLQEIFRLVPKTTCIESFSIDKGNKNIILRMVSKPDKDETEFKKSKNFIAALQNSPFFSKDIKLESQERTELRGKEVYKFTILIPCSKIK